MRSCINTRAELPGASQCLGRVEGGAVGRAGLQASHLTTCSHFSQLGEAQIVGSQIKRLTLSLF